MSNFFHYNFNMGSVSNFWDTTDFSYIKGSIFI